MNIKYCNWDLLDKKKLLWFKAIMLAAYSLYLSSYQSEKPVNQDYL